MIFPIHARMTPDAIEHFKRLDFVLKQIYDNYKRKEIMEKFIFNWCHGNHFILTITEGHIYDVNCFAWDETREGMNYWAVINQIIEDYYQRKASELGMDFRLSFFWRRIKAHIDDLYTKSLVPCHIELDCLE